MHNLYYNKYNQIDINYINKSYNKNFIKYFVKEEKILLRILFIISIAIFIFLKKSKIRLEKLNNKLLI